MPRDACIRTTPEDRLGEEKWSVETDLLALLVEVSSVTASGRQIKKPLEIPRPKRAATPRPTSAEDVDKSFKRGIAVLASTAKGVNR